MPTQTASSPSIAPPVTTQRRDVIVSLAGLWPVAGLYLDGWAHTHVPGLETFFTPWHAVLYSGFVVLVGCLVPAELYRRRPRGVIRGRVPVGYGPGLVGALLFAVGGVADMVWHSLLGVEIDLEALLSPPHLLLLTAGTLMLATPLRAAGARRSPPAGLLTWLPATVSAFTTTAVAAFFLEYLSPFLDVPAANGHEASQVLGAGEYLLTSVLLVVPVLYAWSRWGRVPPGIISVVGLAVTVPVGVLNDFEFVAGQLAGLTGAVAADLVVQALGRRRPGLVPLVAGVTIPILVWSLHLLGVAVTVGIAWPVELWSGVVVLCALGGAVLGGLLLPSRPIRGRPSICPTGAVAPQGPAQGGEWHP